MSVHSEPSLNFERVRIGGYELDIDPKALYGLMILSLIIVLGLIIGGIVYATPFSIGIFDDPEPEADLITNSSDYEMRVGEPVKLDASDSENPTDEPLTYAYDVTGNGAYDYSNEDETMTHVYNEPGEHTAQVYVETVDGEMDTATTTVKIAEPIEASNLSVSQDNQHIRLEFNATEEIDIIESRINHTSSDYNATLSESDFDTTSDFNYTATHQPDESGEYNITGDFDIGIEGESSLGSEVQGFENKSVFYDNDTPELRNGTTINNTNTTFVVSDNHSYVNTSTIDNDTFEVKDGELEKVDVLTEEDSRDILVSAYIEEPVESENTTISIKEDEFVADVNDNRLTSEDNESSVKIKDIDGVAPMITNTELIDTTTIDVNITERGSGLAIPDDPRTLFSATPGYIENATFQDNATESTDTLRLELAQPVDSETIDLELERALKDNLDNELTEFNTTLNDTDGVPPRIHDVELVQPEFISIYIEEDGSGLNENSVDTDSFEVEDREILDVTLSDADESDNATIDSNVTVTNTTDTEALIALNDSLPSSDSMLNLTEDGIEDNAENVKNNDSFSIDVTAVNAPDVNEFEIEQEFDLLMNITLITDSPAELIDVRMETGQYITEDDFELVDENNGNYTYNAVVESEEYGELTGEVDELADEFGNNREEFNAQDTVNLPEEWQMNSVNPSQSGYSQTDETPLTTPSNTNAGITTEAGSSASSISVVGDHIFSTDTSGNLLSTDINTGIENYEWPIADTINTSPAIRGDNVVVTAEDGTLQNVNPLTHEVKWTVETDNANPTSPIIVDDVIVVGSSTNLYTYELESGDEIWPQNLGDEITTTPAVEEDKIITGTESGIYALDVDTANDEWDDNFDSPVRDIAIHEGNIATITEDMFYLYDISGDKIESNELDNMPTNVSISDELIVITFNNGEIKGYDYDTGNELWNEQFGEEGEEHTLGNPTITTDLVMFTESDDRIWGLDTLDGDDQWDVNYNDASIKGSDLVIVDDSIYIATEEEDILIYE